MTGTFDGILHVLCYEHHCPWGKSPEEDSGLSRSLVVEINQRE